MPNDVVYVKIEGLEELSARMQDFPRRVLTRGVRDALRAGAEVLRKEISNRAPVMATQETAQGHPPGFLKDHIGTKLKISARNDSGEAQVGPVKKAFWGLFAEFGTKKQPMKPFIRPAFESAKQGALDAFVAKLRDAFDGESE
jgi:HK97 gp10 family phage protein